jgi:hypothetical protein
MDGVEFFLFFGDLQLELAPFCDLGRWKMPRFEKIFR